MIFRPDLLPMSTADLLLAATIPSWNDELFQLELRVARRADELAVGGQRNRDGDRDVWSRAERELLGTMATAGGSASGLAVLSGVNPRGELAPPAREDAACLVEG